MPDSLESRRHSSRLVLAKQSVKVPAALEGIEEGYLAGAI